MVRSNSDKQFEFVMQCCHDGMSPDSIESSFFEQWPNDKEALLEATERAYFVVLPEEATSLDWSIREDTAFVLLFYLRFQ